VKDHFEWLEQIQTMFQRARRLTGLSTAQLFLPSLHLRCVHQSILLLVLN